MTKYIDGLNRIVWGAPALVLIVGVGLYLSLRLRFAQLTLFPGAWRRFVAMLRLGRKSEDGVTPFQALCTALAATVGTGNIVGVAGAICLGGPGAVFWMWICGVLGMVTKYAEVTLALRYRVKTPAGWIGGPMYVIIQGLGAKFSPMAVAYCLFGVVASFGVGNATQINAVISGVNDVVTRFGGEQTKLGNLVMGLVLAALVGAGCFIGYALVLEQLLHAAVFSLFPAITLYPAAYTAYGCLAAGLFEETGRLMGLSLLCKKDRDLALGVGYGIGHGGVEAALLAGVNAAVNAAVMLGAPAAPQVTDALGAAGAGAFWAAGVERIAAMALHMALSILVWMAVTRRVPIWYYFAAVLLHAAANIPAALSQLGLLRSMWCSEGIILAVNAAVCLFVWSVYRKACVHRPLAG